MESNMATVIKEGPLCLLDVKDQGFKKTKYWVVLSTTPQEHVYLLHLYYYSKSPREPWRLFRLERDTFSGSECGLLNHRVNSPEERYWALVLSSGTLLFQEARGNRRRFEDSNSVEIWDNKVRECMRDRGQWMCRSVVSPDPPLPEEFVVNLTEVSLGFNSLMANNQSAQSHGLWDLAHVEINEPEYQNVSQQDGQFLKLAIGQPGKRKGVYILKLPPRARLELVTKMRTFQSRLGPPTPPRPGAGNVQSRPLPITPPPTAPRPPTHLSPGSSPHTQPTHPAPRVSPRTQPSPRTSTHSQPTHPFPGASPHTQPTHLSPRTPPHSQPTHALPVASSHTQALNAGSHTSENSGSPSPMHQALTPPFRGVGLASNPPSSSGRCPAPPSPTRKTPPRLPTPGPHSRHFHRPAGEEKRPLPSPPNGAPSPDEHTYLQLENQSCPLPDTGGPPPVPYHRSESQTSDRRRVLPRTPSPTQEDRSVRPRRSTDPGVPSTLAPVETSFPVARTPNIVVDEFKDNVAAAGNDANKQNRSTTPDKPLLPKKRVQWRKEDLERRYKNIPDSCTQSEHCTQPVTINSEPTDDDTQYYSVVPAEKDSGAYKNLHASSAQRSSDRHVYMNTPPAHVGDRSRVYMKCMSTDDHTTEDAERLMVAANVKRSGSMPLLTDLPDPASIPYYNFPDLKAEPFYQNPNLKGQKGSRCPPPPSVAPGDSQKKPVPAPRRTASKQELHSVEYYEEHPMHPCKEEQNQDGQKKDIMSVIMDRSLEEDSLGLPKEKWEKLLLLLCFPSPLQNDWRVLASKLDLTNVDVMLLESVRENYKELPARYVFKYWQRHGPLPYTRQEVQRVLIELERLELAGMFDDYCTLPIKPVS